jgi:hypothetical protein
MIAEHMARMGQTRNTYRILVGKPPVNFHFKDREGDERRG